MIIRPNNMTPNDFQRQVNNMTKMKRGFNQVPQELKQMVNGNRQNNTDMLKESLKLRDKMNSLKKGPKNQ